MAVPTDIEIWASSDGSAIVGSLVATAAQWQSNITQSGVQYGVIRFSFSGSPNLSAVIAGHVLTITGMSNANNNGENMEIYAANNTSDTIDVLMTERTSSADDETGSTGAGSVTDTGARRKKPSASKIGMGFRVPEKISDGHLNWLFNRCTEWIDYFANGGAAVLRGSLAVWKAVTARSGDGFEIVQGVGAYRFDVDSTEIADDEAVIAPDDGIGRGYLEAAHPDQVFAILESTIGQPFESVSFLESLDFPSISAGSYQSLTVSYSDASPLDEVRAIPETPVAGLTYHAIVSSSGVITVTVVNHTGGSINPDFMTYQIILRKY